MKADNDVDAMQCGNTSAENWQQDGVDGRRVCYFLVRHHLYHVQYCAARHRQTQRNVRAIATLTISIYLRASMAAKLWYCFYWCVCLSAHKLKNYWRNLVETLKVTELCGAIFLNRVGTYPEEENRNFDIDY